MVICSSFFIKHAGVCRTTRITTTAMDADGGTMGFGQAGWAIISYASVIALVFVFGFIKISLQKDIETDLHLPWTSDDNSYKIIDKSDKTVLSVLDLSIAKTPKAMKAFERFFGKNITTRNWNTIKRIEKKLEG